MQRRSIAWVTVEKKSVKGRSPKLQQRPLPLTIVNNIPQQTSGCAPTSFIQNVTVKEDEVASEFPPSFCNALPQAFSLGETIVEKNRSTFQQECRNIKSRKTIMSYLNGASDRQRSHILDTMNGNDNEIRTKFLEIQGTSEQSYRQPWLLPAFAFASANPDGLRCPQLRYSLARRRGREREVIKPSNGRNNAVNTYKYLNDFSEGFSSFSLRMRKGARATSSRIQEEKESN